MKIPVVQSSPYRKKTKSSPTTVHLPTHSLNKGDNVRGMSGEIFVRDYQYPATIRTLLRKLTEERLKLFLGALNNDSRDLKKAIEKSDGVDYSTSGCLRWVYDSTYFNDIQERYEAADNVSFDVRGNFCYSCELSRKMVELKPVIFETPEENQEEIQLDRNGYTDKTWDWISEPEKNAIKQFPIDKTDESVILYEVSSDVFRYILNMIVVKANLNQFREPIFTYKCGSNRVNLLEKVPRSSPPTDLDFQSDIVSSLRDLEDVKDLGLDCVFTINVSEINPYVTDGDGYDKDQCYYTNKLKINQNSNIIHNMNVNLKLSNGSTVIFVCPEYSINVDYNIILNIPEYPDLDIYYPYLFYCKKNIGGIILYCMMYLMEDNRDGEFSKVVDSQPEAFYLICRNCFGKTDSETLRKRLIVYKRNSNSVGYLKAIKYIRNSFISLKTTQH